MGQIFRKKKAPCFWCIKCSAAGAGPVNQDCSRPYSLVWGGFVGLSHALAKEVVVIAQDDIVQRIEGAIPGAQVRVEDLTGGGDHYQVEVIAEAFAGKSPIQRHRMVYAPLKDVMGGALHALALTTKTPDE